MKRFVSFIAILTVGALLLAGCNITVTPPETSSVPETTAPQTPEVTNPETIDLFVDTKSVMDRSNDIPFWVEYPELVPGYRDFAGNVVSSGSDALRQALESYNENIKKQQADVEATLRAGTIYADEDDLLYSKAEAFITRNDTAVLSFFERIETDYGYVKEGISLRGYTWDAATAKPLTFQDVFKAPDSLAEVLEQAFRECHDDISLRENTLKLLQDAVEFGARELSFALGHGCVHIFAEDQFLAAAPGALHIVLSAEFLKEEYALDTESWMMKMPYGVTLPLGDSITAGIHWFPSEEGWGELTLTANDETLTEELFNVAPACYLVYRDSQYLLFLKEPAADVSNRSRFYEFTEDGVSFLGYTDTAIREDTSLNPDRVAMDLDDILYLDNFMLLAWSFHTLDMNGMTRIDEAYGLMSRELMLNADVELVSVSTEDPTAASGTVTVTSGTLLTPFRTDMDSYLDLLDGDGKAYRLPIDQYSEDMQFPGYPALNELFS